MVILADVSVGVASGAELRMTPFVVDQTEVWETHAARSSLRVLFNKYDTCA
jgi:hypothetical protein